MYFIVWVFFLCLSSVLAVDNILLLYAVTPSSSRRSERKSRCAILPHILGLEGKQCPNPSYGKGHLSGYQNASLKLECPILPWNLGVLKEDIGYDDWWHECSKSNEVPLTIGMVFIGIIYIGAAIAGLASGIFK
jgi:hypothetical protein